MGPCFEVLSRRRRIVALAACVLIVGCTSPSRLAPSSSCADFIHAAWGERSAVVDEAESNLRLHPSSVVMPSVEEVALVCDAYPDITIAEAVGQAVGHQADG